MYEDEHIDQFNLDPNEYLKQLVPPTEEVQSVTPGLPSHLMSRSALSSLPLHDRVKIVMMNGRLHMKRIQYFGNDFRNKMSFLTVGDV